jgi:K+ transporter
MQAHNKQAMTGLTLAALGVVYGDIGTSPLYTLRECFTGHGMATTPENIFGILSLIFWSLIFVVSIKYVVFVLRADNHGEGGIMALMALARHYVTHAARWKVVLLGLFGARCSMAMPSSPRPCRYYLRQKDWRCSVQACSLMCCPLPSPCWLACLPCNALARPA